MLGWLADNAMRLALGAAFLVVLALPFALQPEHAAEAVAGEGYDDLPARELIMVSPHSEGIRKEFEWAFSRWTAETRGFRTEVEWLDQGGTIQAMKWVDDQFRARPNGIGVDIFFGGGSDPFLHFGRKGLLHRCDLPRRVLDRIPRTHAGAEIYDEQQRWFGACLSGFGLVYNKAVLEFLDLSEPDAWADLARPGLATWVASADPRLSGSMHMAYEIILQAYGWREGWGEVLRIGANCRSFTRAASEVPKEVAAGEAAVGMAIDFYGLKAVAEAGSQRMAFALPEGLTVVNPDGIGVLKGALHPQLAELFVQFVLSERGQKIWMLAPGAPGGPELYTLYRLPVIPGMIQQYRRHSVVSVDPFEFEGGIEFDLEKKNDRWGILNALLGAAIIDVHPELRRAWRVVRNLPPDDPRMLEFLEPPLAERELMEMARNRWSDPGFRAETVAAWSNQAAKRYRRLAESE